MVGTTHTKDITWPGPSILIEFIDELRIAGYNIGANHYIAAQDLILALLAQHDTPIEPQQLGLMLGPLLCSSPSEQADFPQRFEMWMKRVIDPVNKQLNQDNRREQSLTTRSEQDENTKQSVKQHIEAAEEELKEIEQGSRWWIRAFIVIIAFVIWGLLFYYFQGMTTSISYRSTPTPSYSPIRTSEPTIGLTTASTRALVAPTVTRPISAVERTVVFIHDWRTWCMLFTALLIILTWRLWWFYRVHLFLLRHATTNEPEIHRISVRNVADTLFPTMLMTQITKGFRTRFEVASKALNVNGTVRNSVQKAGWFIPVYSRQRIMPEYLVLIDRRHYRDHQAHFVDELIARLQENGVFIEVYYFDRDPRICVPATENRMPLTLKEIAIKHHNYQLILFADHRELFHPLTGELSSWTEQFSAWSQPTLMTPESIAFWDERELALLERLTVLPPTPEGLVAFVQSINYEYIGRTLNSDIRKLPPYQLRHRPLRWLENEPLDPLLVEKTLTELQQFLGDAGFMWLSACAIYPEINWNITLYLGDTLQTDNGEKVMDQGRLMNLVGLPWFRYAYMPDWLRIRLIKALPSAQEQIIRNSLKLLFATTVLGVTDRFQLEIASAHRSMLARLASPLLHILAKKAEDDSPLREQVFLNFMLKSRQPLLFQLPEQIIELLAKQRGLVWKKQLYSKALKDIPSSLDDITSLVTDSKTLQDTLSNQDEPTYLITSSIAPQDPLSSPDTLSSHYITFLFTDIEGNAGLWRRFPEKIAAVLRRHDELIETIVKQHDGQVVRPRGEGDSRFIVFTYPQNVLNAVVAAGEIQKALYAEPWPIPVPLRVRIALHTGDAIQITDDYYGPEVNRCAGIRTLAYGGQTLLSAQTAALAQAALPPDLQLRDLQYHYLKGETQSQQIFQLVVAGIPNEFLPLKKQPIPDIVKKQFSPEQRKRQALIENVQHGWIDGILNRSLQQSIMLNLRIALAPTAISPLSSPENHLLVDQPSPAYLTQTAITEIYEQFDHHLLVLGAPGSGKTTLLMLLTSMLLGKAERNNDAPIPVILNLSSWAAKRSHLEVWLIEELERQFRVPKAIGRAWVQNQQIVPLLDGLDEVAFAQRDACVAAINEYQKTHSVQGLVVCCRRGEYATLQTQLTLGAIEVQPLPFAEIETYFKHLGARFYDLIMRLQQDNALRELITSPLLVSILTVVQEDLPQTVADMPMDEYRTLLFTRYVEHDLRPTARRRPSTADEPFREPSPGSYSLAQVQQWLGWLAAWLHDRNETIFYIEDLQPEALTLRHRRWYKMALAFLLALTVGLLVGLGVKEPNTGIIWGVSAWLITLMLMGEQERGTRSILPWTRPIRNSLLIGGVVGIAESIQLSLSHPADAPFLVLTVAPLVEILLIGIPAFIASLVLVRFANALYNFINDKISKESALPVTVALWITFSISIGITPFYLAGIYLAPEYYSFFILYQASLATATSTLVCSSLFVSVGHKIQPVERLRWSWPTALLFTFLAVATYLWNKPITAIISTSIIALSGLTGTATIETRRSPNQGIWQSMRYSGLSAGIGVIIWFFLWAISSHTTPIGISLLPAISLLAALRSGLIPYLQHALIRLILWWEGAAPFDYAHFLEAMVSNSLLYRTGGGYIFIHRLMLEYFLNLAKRNET